jgi:multicomponent K+:H+ antiporter subunit G
MSDLPLWAEIVAAILLVCGGLLVALGSFGLLTLRDFFARMHPPTMGTTLGTACVLLASMLVSSVLLSRPMVHEILIAIFVALSAPVTAMLLARAAVYRSGRNRSLPTVDGSTDESPGER